MEKKRKIGFLSVLVATIMANAATNNKVPLLPEKVVTVNKNGKRTITYKYK